jgi:hypothetical protein
MMTVLGVLSFYHVIYTIVKTSHRNIRCEKMSPIILDEFLGRATCCLAQAEDELRG